jgi:riboflavin kinase/FMN adenylyltransferase
MRIVNGVEQLEPRPRVVVLGTFDGVHLGHRRLIQEALGRAQELGAITTVATFEPMPSEMLRPGQVPRRLSGIERARADRAARAPTSC